MESDHVTLYDSDTRHPQMGPGRDKKKKKRQSGSPETSDWLKVGVSSYCLTSMQTVWWGSQSTTVVDDDVCELDCFNPEFTQSETKNLSVCMLHNRIPERSNPSRCQALIHLLLFFVFPL